MASGIFLIMLNLIHLDQIKVLVLKRHRHYFPLYVYGTVVSRERLSFYNQCRRLHPISIEALYKYCQLSVLRTNIFKFIYFLSLQCSLYPIVASGIFLIMLNLIQVDQIKVRVLETTPPLFPVVTCIRIR